MSKDRDTFLKYKFKCMKTIDLSIYIFIKYFSIMVTYILTIFIQDLWC